MLSNDAMEDERRHSGLDKPSISKVARKKFAKPPVKVACLSCRASRIRCDGKDPCSCCALKGKECSYLPSKRGGPRKKRVDPPSSIGENMQNRLWATVHPIPRIDEEIFTQVDDLAVPGAGLRHLDFPVDVQSMFEGLFVPPNTQQQPSAHPPANQAQVPASEPPREKCLNHFSPVFTTSNHGECRLNAYYIYIHYYFPIFPPPHTPITVDRPLNAPTKAPATASTDPLLPYRPKSPVTLAISAILALIPHPRDPNSFAPESVLLRRSYAHTFAREAVASIEAESDLHESGTSPSEALAHNSTIPARLPVHPLTPIDLEGILALLILSIYEYTQRGNLIKMRHRAGQAYIMAMNLSLHAISHDESAFAEARRRAWWMTFYCVCQGAIVGTMPATILTHDPRFTTPYPRFASDSRAWSILIQAQQALVAATQYIIDLNQALRARANLAIIFERMEKLTAWTSSILAQADAQLQEPATSPHDIEGVTAQSIRCISRIKLCSARIKTHRFRAFLDIPIFIKKHCDLSCASIGSPSMESTSNIPEYQDTMRPVLCCSSSFNQLPGAAPPTQLESPISSSSPISDCSGSHWIPENSFPFSNYTSTSICLDAALTIAQMFDSLPYPRPTYDKEYASLEYTAIVPRTMPSFACCAMQSSYAMLMLYYKSRAINPENVESPLSDPDQLSEELQHGLECVIGAVRNYSIAFEALDGMRDEIEVAFLTAFPQE
ncbi:uncharacterized protein GIQ15_02806 [Arthroderma uncinatum]|uniref:uncharacterized protein n=1 Tax=Arthroderma uncinatum TaxID=74035 RepID=UPI00144A6213|nr:uncharacterized protein GIQ15_02806 [Arthroderma uncinatum]KAF3483482.1 hypothetical protein GIQ15_02806 [Arthroderma uncinatum]